METVLMISVIVRLGKLAHRFSSIHSFLRKKEYMNILASSDNTVVSLFIFLQLFLLSFQFLLFRHNNYSLIRCFLIFPEGTFMRVPIRKIVLKVQLYLQIPLFE